MSSTLTSFSKIKKIISDIKSEINSFQSKISDLTTNGIIIYRDNKYVPYVKNEESSVISEFGFSTLSREQKINLFNKERNSRIQEIKKQLNFLDYIFLSDEKNENLKHHSYAKLKSIKAILDEDEYKNKQVEIEDFFDSILNKEPTNRDELLDKLINEVETTKIETTEEQSASLSEDFIVTHDFIAKLKNDGKEITENFKIQEKANQKGDISIDDDSWFSIDSNEVPKEKVVTVNSDNFLDLLSKK